MARVTINTKISTPEDLKALIRNLRSLDPESLEPGADITLKNVRVQVADVQLSDIRAFALKYGFPVGSRGVISQTIKDAYAQFLDTPHKPAAISRARRQAREAREAVNA